MKKNKKFLIVVVTIAVVGTMITTSTFAYTSNDFSKHNKNRGSQNIQEAKTPKTIGVVSNIDGTNITIVKHILKRGSDNKSTEKTYTVDASSATINKFTPTTDGAKPSPVLITISDIKIGDTLIVDGVVTDNNIKATTITDGTLGKSRMGMNR